MKIPKVINKSINLDTAFLKWIHVPKKSCQIRNEYGIGTKIGTGTGNSTDFTESDNF